MCLLIALLIRVFRRAKKYRWEDGLKIRFFGACLISYNLPVYIYMDRKKVKYRYALMICFFDVSLMIFILFYDLPSY